MKISIALCTYNGEKFLSQQLATFSQQTRRPDEVIVSDDRSTDSTAAIVEAFARTSDVPVLFVTNSKRLGSTRNFEQAISRCTGDIIFLADQDDIWLPDKIRTFEKAFTENPETGLFFSDAELIDENSQKLGKNLWNVTFPKAKRRQFDGGRVLQVLLWGWTVTGATMAIRSDLIRHLGPTPDLGLYIHDGWIALTAAVVSKVGYIPSPQIQYRIHAGQQIGVGPTRQRSAETTPIPDFETAITHLSTVISEVNALTKRLEGSMPPGKSIAIHRELEDWIQHLQIRMRLPKSPLKKLPAISKELLNGGYFKYSNGFRSLLRDLLRLDEPVS